jgi:Protein of unknown function (DUF1073)
MADSNGNGTKEYVEQVDAFSGFMNHILGIGDPNYDSSTADAIDTSLELLSDSEISAISAKSRIVKRLIDIYPTDANFGFPSINSTYGNYGVTSEQITDYINDKLIDSRSLSLEKAFRIASRKARKWGVHYLVLGVNDGRIPSDPIDENNIQTFEFITLKNKYELMPDDYLNPSYYQFNYDFRGIETDNLNSMKGMIRIHPDRVLVFYGEELPESFEGIFRPISTLQSCLDAVLSRMSGLKQGKQLLTKKAILWAALNPPQTIVNPELKFEALNDRLRKINLLANSHKMVGMNQNETLGALQIDLNGVDKVLAANDTELLAQSDMVRYKLFGESAHSGLSQSSAGIEQKIDHADRSSRWANDHWADHLTRVYSLVCLAKDSPSGGRRLKGLSVAMRTHPDLSPVEWAELRKLNSEWAIPFINAGVVTKEEIRMSFFDGSKLDSQLIPNLQLHEEYTQQLRDEILMSSDQGMLQTDGDNFISDVSCDLIFDLEQVDCSEWADEQMDESMFPYLVWFCDADGSNKHRTPVAVKVSGKDATEARANAIVAARKKCSRNCSGTYAVRLATSSEQKTAASGNWIRTGAKGQAAGYSGVKGVGTPLGGHKQTDAVNNLSAGYSGLTHPDQIDYQDFPNFQTDSSVNHRIKNDKEERSLLAKRKQSQDPNKDRSGAPVNVSSKLQKDDAVQVGQINEKLLTDLLSKMSEIDDNGIDQVLREL